MDNRSKEMSAGNAAKVAAQLTNLALTTGMDLDAVVECWASIYPKVTATILAHTEEVAPEFVPTVPGPAAPVAPAPAFNPEAALQAAFPGSTMQTTPQVAAAPTNVVQFPAAQQAAVVAPPAPAPIPGASTGGVDPFVAQAWEQFFADVASGQFANNWTDNRASKRGANSPDFKHKSWKQPDNPRYNVSLYIESRKNPADIKARLAAIGIAS